MCVDYLGYDWERSVTKSDLPYFKNEFPDIDFEKFMQAMSQDGGVPLTTDMALIGGMLSTKPDDLGMCFVPFAGLEHETNKVIKLPIMGQVVDWFENTALGTDMWQHASEVSEELYGGKFHFAMNCGCGFVSNQSKIKGDWKRWQERFNASRKYIYGKTVVVHREVDSILNTDITAAQLNIWKRMRSTLEALPAISNMNIVNVVSGNIKITEQHF